MLSSGSNAIPAARAQSLALWIETAVFWVRRRRKALTLEISQSTQQGRVPGQHLGPARFADDEDDDVPAPPQPVAGPMPKALPVVAAPQPVKEKKDNESYRQPMSQETRAKIMREWNLAELSDEDDEPLVGKGKGKARAHAATATATEIIELDSDGDEVMRKTRAQKSQPAHAASRTVKRSADQDEACIDLTATSDGDDEPRAKRQRTRHRVKSPTYYHERQASDSGSSDPSSGDEYSGVDAIKDGSSEESANEESASAENESDSVGSSEDEDAEEV